MLALVLQQLCELAGVFERQASYHFFSSSVLLLYEGAARSATEARVAVRLIDFAHAFPTDCTEGVSGPDANTLAGLRGLISAVEAAAAAPVDESGSGVGAAATSGSGACCACKQQ